MMNNEQDIFLRELDDSLSGKNFGLSTGLISLDYAIGKLNKKTFYGIASAPKVGKSALTLTNFIIEPYLDAKKKGKKFTVIYLSYEMDLVKNMARVTSTLYSKLTKNYDVSPRYFFGKEIDQTTGEYIKPNPADLKKYKEIYHEYTVPMFGKRDKYGKLIEPGIIKFFGQSDNPTGVFKLLQSIAKEKGELVYDTWTINGKEHRRIISYKPFDENELVLVVLDNLRKLIPEQGMTLKQAADRMISYMATLRNYLGWSFLAVIHLNRELSNVERLKYLGENIYPDNSDIKETGNLSEEADVMLTMFNPKDTKYRLKRHMGRDLTCCEHYRSLHIIEARDVPSPVHIGFEFKPASGIFLPVKDKLEQPKLQFDEVEHG